jgi:N-acetylglucosaminyldiphosphoundecaprenol N-acetyl-beta-D-mannosaminyltransferase
MIDYGKRNVLGVGVDAVDYEAATARIIARARSGARCVTSALAVHGVITGALDRVHRFRINTFDLVVPDGQPVRWALNSLYGLQLKDRVYGPTLMLRVCREAARSELPVYFYGSSETVVRQLCDRMSRCCPSLRIAGSQPSQFRRLTRGECADTVREIRESGARILFVGLGCPRQEVFAYEMSAYLSMPILAVGAAFDYHAGLLREPPETMQALGLQWLYRLAQEPRRLCKRYLITNSQFVVLFLLQCLRLWRPDPSNADPPSNEWLYG